MKENAPRFPEALQRALLSNSTEGILIFHAPSGTPTADTLMLTHINPAGERLLGCDSETAEEKTLGELFPEHSLRWRNRLKRSFTEGVNETLFYQPDISRERYTITASAVDSEYLLLIFHKDSHSSIKDASTEKSFPTHLLMANISHELRTPLNGIIGMASLLEESIEDEEQRELLSMIGFSANNLSRIIRDLLELNRIESGQISLTNTLFSLQETADRILREVDGIVRKKNLKITLETDYNLPEYYGDRNKIAQILGNLVNNAVQFTDEGWISVSITRQAKQLLIQVQDTGIGIPEDELEVIFKNFRVGEDPYTKEYSGLGIGLSIVSHLVHRMSGTIRVDSSEGKGSLFTISLPWTNTGERQNGEKKPGRSSADERLKILIAEDEAINRIYIRTLLERQGYLVEEAKNGEEACLMAAGTDPSFDLILMDIYMPKKNGVDAIAEIRGQQNSHTGAPAIIAMTATSDQDERNNAMNAGADGFISKPLSETNLIRCISKIIKDKQK